LEGIGNFVIGEVIKASEHGRGNFMKFGLAKVSITPLYPVKLACTGNFSDDFTDIHDDVYVRCIIMDDEKNKIILMSMDLLFHSRDLNIAIAEYAEKKYGINPSNVIVTYTHAHTAPAVKGYNPGHHNDDYENFIIAKAFECIDKAMMSAFEGSLSYGSFETELNVSRRKMENGHCETLPNLNGERDTEMFLLCVRDTDDNIRGIVVNYACHPVFYPASTTLSSEFPGRVCQLLDAEYYGCISVYTQSAGGDVRPMPTVMSNGDGSLTWNRNMKFSDIDQFAEKICTEIVSYISNDKLKKIDVCIKSDTFEVRADIEKAPKANFIKHYEELKSDPHNPVFVQCNEILNGLYEQLDDYLIIHCNTIKLNDDLYIAAIAGEPCFNVKKIVKSAFDDKNVCFIGYTDSCAYLVDDKILEEGGYEPGSYPEYGLAGSFKLGMNSLYYNGFKNSLNRING